MIGDNIELKPKYLIPAQQILNKIGGIVSRTTICIGGESGSGKSTLAFAIKKLLVDQAKECAILHMDDYFFLPPKSNHEARLNDISHVGPAEVNLELLAQHISAFKKGESSIDKPLVDYKVNLIIQETLDFKNTDVLIIEGTYTNLIKQCDHSVFIDRTYKDTYADRIRRARDPIIPFNERVLAIEHEIVSKLKSNATFIMDATYNISLL